MRMLGWVSGVNVCRYWLKKARIRRHAAVSIKVIIINEDY